MTVVRGRLWGRGWVMKGLWGLCRALQEGLGVEAVGGGADVSCVRAVGPLEEPWWKGTWGT